MLRLSDGHYQVMEAHALEAYPQECCGLILGCLLEQGERQAMEIRPVENAWSPAIEAEHQQMVADAGLAEGHSQEEREHSHSDRFYIDPRDLLKAQKYARTQGWQIIGIYHSHPDHVAEPSERDRQSAWPEYSYIILSVQSGQVMDCKSWRLNEINQFEPEPWQLEIA